MIKSVAAAKDAWADPLTATSPGPGAAVELGVTVMLASAESAPEAIVTGFGENAAATAPPDADRLTT